MPKTNLIRERAQIIEPAKFTPNGESIIELRNWGLIQEIWLNPLITFDHGATRATGKRFGSVLNLIKRIYVEVNGSNILCALSGADLAAMYMLDWGDEVEEYYDPDATIYGGVYCPLTFILARTNSMLKTALDLRTRENTNLDVTLRIEWGDVPSMYKVPNDTTIVSGQVEITARYVENYAGVDILPVRDLSVREYAIPANEHPKKITIDRRKGAIISRIYVMTYDDGDLYTGAVGYGELLTDNTIKLRENTSVMHRRESALRQFELPRGILPFDLLNYGDLATAEYSDNNDSDMELSFLVNTAGAKSKMRVITEYVRPLREN